MRRHGYAGYPEHLASHQHFVDELARLDKLYDRAGLSDAVITRTAAYITEWLSSHFIEDDRRLADFLQERGARLHRSQAAA